ncbi:hypothetical protein DY000_02049855 [Brassica cretica]|uniref:Retrotransposon gag domain-containing protein n=1 Tax=Brassica cretica TaxID=69181 RepID=A0ABQ7EVK9_BRACR|nr:hypothetical protein DY000_02049855 [Brassica cretica]
MKQGDSTVREYNTLFLKSGLLEIHQQETLVMMYRDGLREEIRAELGVHVFSTIDDIMQAALDVEEGVVWGLIIAGEDSPTAATG